MSASKIDVLVFSFEQDYGSREDCSVFYCEPLVVLAPESARPAVKRIIEGYIQFDYNDESYDEEFDKNALLQGLLNAGYPASWSRIDPYVNED